MRVLDVVGPARRVVRPHQVQLQPEEAHQHPGARRRRLVRDPELPLPGGAGDVPARLLPVRRDVGGRLRRPLHRRERGDAHDPLPRRRCVHRRPEGRPRRPGELDGEGGDAGRLHDRAQAEPRDRPEVGRARRGEDDGRVRDVVLVRRREGDDVVLRRGAHADGLPDERARRGARPAGAAAQGALPRGARQGFAREHPRPGRLRRAVGRPRPPHPRHGVLGGQAPPRRRRRGRRRRCRRRRRR